MNNIYKEIIQEMSKPVYGNLIKKTWQPFVNDDFAQMASLRDETFLNNIPKNITIIHKITCLTPFTS